MWENWRNQEKKSDLEEEKEEIINTIKELSEETTTFTIVDKTQETDSTSVAGNTNVNEETEVNNDEHTTIQPEEITTRRLPSRYVNSKTRSRSRPKVTTKPPAKVINHNMNLQTALIINTLSKVRGNIIVDI